MPRTLPWSKSGTATVTAPSKDGRPSKRQKVSHAVSEDEDQGSAATRPRKSRPKQHRTPSTSPPPAPPTPEFMRDGFDKDDIYMMVEDEFLTTAQQFTAHLHHAEYMRLKNLAKSKTSPTARSIARPVDDRTQARPELRKQQQAAELANTQANGLKELAGRAGSGAEENDEEEDEAHDPWMQSAHLAGLMTSSPRKSQTLMPDIAATRANTRAAAGYTSARNPSPARVKPILPPSPAPTRAEAAVFEDASDLDAPVVSKSRPWPQLELGTSDGDMPKPSLVPSREKGRPPDRASEGSSLRRDVSAFFKSSLKPPLAASSDVNSGQRAKDCAVSFAPSQSGLRSQPSLSDIPPGPQPNVSDNAPSRPPLSAEAIARLARRKAERARREREKTTVRADEVPTFLV